MKSQKITLKIILGYSLLILTSATVAIITYGEIQKLTTSEEIHQMNRGKMLRINKILTLINEAESAGKIAIRSDDEQALGFFLEKNRILEDSIAKFRESVSSSKHLQMIDSVQILLQLKSKNLQELKEIQRNDSSTIIIRNAIKKLSSLEPSLGYFLLNDNLASAKEKEKTEPRLDSVREANRSDIPSILNRYKDIKIPPTRSQSKFDETVLEALRLLNRVHKETLKHEYKQNEKIQTLWHNDNRMSEKLNDLLSNFEDDFLASSQEINRERRIIFEKSKTYLIISYIFAIIITIFFSFVIVRDFWKIQKYRHELERANLKSNRLLKSREQLVSMVSHDLRTPLSSIIGYSELLGKQEITEKSKNYLSHIKYSSEYIQKLVDELLDYSKLEAGKVSVEKVPLNIAEIIREVTDNVRSIHKAKPIALRVEASEVVQQSKFSNDSYRIKQILYNLISNAFKFTEAGEICIESHAKAISDKIYEIVIAVTDSGIGIKKEHQAHIFDEFTQASLDVSKRYGGSGLGLHISQKLAHLLKGNITLVSEENVGSTFTLTFVAEKVSEAPKVSAPQVTSEKAPEQITILAIDDDATILGLIEELLQQKNIKVFPFNNGKEAFSKMNSLEFDMVITDIQLPEMNGFHFVTLFNEKYKNNPIPVLAITGRKDVPESFYTQNGFSGILSKPFSPHQFYQKLNTFFPRIEVSPDVVEPLPTESTAYQPEVLEQFMGDDKEGIIALYQSFISETQDNIARLKLYATTRNNDEVRAIAHKMLSMFGQINARREVDVLNHLNHISTESVLEIILKIEELEDLFVQECKPAIEAYCKL
ncbi:hybrid sensor histidine kinase/response regulator [Capnocytophaga sp.]|uniref:hybrid sensor histidine kinase/response regulator n=1 Tax=Capnocytophaga sp. TaxID=44737 RepID=UPI0026DC198E|nr:hybrid sensor histidine kinase/response regulator [Capnocytophaga sp.]MDO5104421.1 hybrid sensor histidine kinase/response regulator [Capnocytophaga sp.]